MDSTRVGRDAGRIADEVIAHLAGHMGAEVTVTIEIEARLPNGATDLLVPATPEVWLQRLPRLLDEFFSFKADDEGGEQRLRKSVETWAEQLKLSDLLNPSTPGAHEWLAGCSIRRGWRCAQTRATATSPA